MDPPSQQLLGDSGATCGVCSSRALEDSTGQPRLCCSWRGPACPTALLWIQHVDICCLFVYGSHYVAQAGLKLIPELI